MNQLKYDFLMAIRKHNVEEDEHASDDEVRIGKDKALPGADYLTRVAISLLPGTMSTFMEGVYTNWIQSCISPGVESLWRLRNSLTSFLNVNMLETKKYRRIWKHSLPRQRHSRLWTRRIGKQTNTTVRSPR